MVRHLDPAAALAYRTPVQEHLLSADGKAAGMLTLLGIMFTVLARCGTSSGPYHVGRWHSANRLPRLDDRLCRARPGGRDSGVPHHLAALPQGSAQPGLLRRHRQALTR